MRGGAGGHDVVQQRDMLGVDGLDDGERLFHVFAALLGGLRCLMRRIFMPTAGA